MMEKAKRFPLDKPTVLNVLYDALESLDVCLEQADSVRGIFYVSAAAPPMHGQITVLPDLLGRETRVEITPEAADSVAWTSVLFDEMTAIIKTTGLIRPRAQMQK